MRAQILFALVWFAALSASSGAASQSTLTASVTPPAIADTKLIGQIVKVLPTDRRPRGPIRVVVPGDVDPARDGRDVGAFTVTGDPNIYISNQTVAYRQALAGDRFSLYVLATCVWHEEQHIQGLGEREAYAAQLDLLDRYITTHQIDDIRAGDVRRTILRLLLRDK
jgi:hypothetical protein